MKTLTLAIVAALTVGASAQTRHYSTGDSVVTVFPDGDKIETRLVHIVPAGVIPGREATPVILPIPANETHGLEVRHYDTADTVDELYFPRDVYYDVIYESRKTTTTIERE